MLSGKHGRRVGVLVALKKPTESRRKIDGDSLPSAHHERRTSKRLPRCWIGITNDSDCCFLFLLFSAIFFLFSAPPPYTTPAGAHAVTVHAVQLWRTRQTLSDLLCKVIIHHGREKKEHESNSLRVRTFRDAEDVCCRIAKSRRQQSSKRKQSTIMFLSSFRRNTRRHQCRRVKKTRAALSRVCARVSRRDELLYAPDKKPCRDGTRKKPEGESVHLRKCVSRLHVNKKTGNKKKSDHNTINSTRTKRPRFERNERHRGAATRPPRPRRTHRLVELSREKKNTSPFPTFCFLLQVPVTCSYSCNEARFCDASRTSRPWRTAHRPSQVTRVKNGLAAARGQFGLARARVPTTHLPIFVSVCCCC